ncbi:MAG: histone deacetylase [Acidobacteriota bacterium]|jgi:acetoin utilization deacetylase AcuC-like enzyme
MTGLGDRALAALRRTGRRALRHAAEAFGASPVAELVYAGRYVLEVPGFLADPHRPEHILTFLVSEGLVRKGTLRWPRPASLEQLCRVHEERYLESLREPGALTRILGIRIPVADEDRFVDLQRSMVGGTLLATRTALQTGRISINLGGGLHHARAGRGQGFCVFNDVAVAIASFREHGFRGRVLVIDLDLHDGDGTRSLFADDASVHTFSVHNAPWGPIDAVESTSITLGDDVEDREYLDTLREHLPSLIDRFRPGLVFYLAGCDPAADDSLGNWRITADGMLERDRFVMEQIRRAGQPPTVIVLAGGYGRESWRYNARFFGWLLSGGQDHAVPGTEEITLMRYRMLSKVIAPSRLTGDAEDEGFGLTEEDLFGAVGPSAREQRFLGFYSRHGMELALEQLGLLRRLRDRGFPHPTLEFELDNPAGQTVRLFGDTDREELLGELRARRDRRTVPGMEMLRVEWLLLQNPRARFGPGRSPLPGQKHPGLGMLRDVVAMLILICDRLSLDGLLFVPSHYHMASQAGDVLQFLKPEDAARFDAMRDALRGLRLADATRAVHQGRLVDRATGEPMEWQPAPMILPVSDRLQERMKDRDVRSRREAARKGFELELR